MQAPLTIRIVYAPLIEHLQGEIDSQIMDPPTESGAVRGWTRRYINSYEPMQSAPAAYEDDISAGANPLIAYPVSALLPDPPVPDSGEARNAKWQHLEQAAKLGMTDWVCLRDGTVGAVVGWKRRMVLPTAQMTALVNTALRSVDLTLDRSGAHAQHGMPANAVKAVFQCWGQAHHYGCRWVGLSNTEAMLVIYLADDRTLLVSRVVLDTDGETHPATTFASVLLSLGLPLSPPPAPNGVTLKDNVSFRTIPLAAIASLQPREVPVSLGVFQVRF